VDPSEARQLLASNDGFAGVDGFMYAARARHGREATGVVGHDAGVGLKMGLRQGLNGLPIMDRSNPAAAALAVALLIVFDCCDQRDFVGPSTSAPTTLRLAFFAAQNRVVHFDPALENHTRTVFRHHAHELVAHKARRIWSHTELSRRFKARDRVLRLR